MKRKTGRLKFSQLLLIVEEENDFKQIKNISSVKLAGKQCSSAFENFVSNE